MAIHTEIEIHRSPEEVRKIFLDFPSYPTWTTGFIKSITPADPADPAAAAAAPGTKLRVALQGMTISPTMVTNDAHEFRWRGMLWALPGLFTGEHQFRFEPSRATPGGTTLVQAETFSGLLAPLIAEGTRFWTATRHGFDGFNADLKRRCEGDT